MVEKEKDTVTRLRGLGNSLRGLDWCDSLVPDDAADEIERLRTKLKRAEDFIKSHVSYVVTEENAALGQERK